MFESCGAGMSEIRNKVDKERDKDKHQSQEKKKTQDKQIDVYGSLLEGKRLHASPWQTQTKLSF